MIGVDVAKHGYGVKAINDRYDSLPKCDVFSIRIKVLLNSWIEPMDYL